MISAAYFDHGCLDGWGLMVIVKWAFLYDMTLIFYELHELDVLEKIKFVSRACCISFRTALAYQYGRGDLNRMSLAQLC